MVLFTMENSGDFLGAEVPPRTGLSTGNPPSTSTPWGTKCLEGGAGNGPVGTRAPWGAGLRVVGWGQNRRLLMSCSLPFPPHKLIVQLNKLTGGSTSDRADVSPNKQSLLLSSTHPQLSLPSYPSLSFFHFSSSPQSDLRAATK